MEPCVTVIDKSKQSVYELTYYVTIDDTAIDLTTDIPLPDAKSHQFFALAGTVIPNGETFRFYPFAPPDADAVLLPDWITFSDVKRAADASSQLTGATFSAQDFPHDMVLEDNPDFTDRWFRISSDTARLPIRVMQSYYPVRWDLTDVPPGAYTLAGYVFSPPYNTWATRTGVIKVRDDQTDPAAGAIGSITSGVFSYEGRHVSLCLDVPTGTQMTTYYHVEEQPALGWMPWLDARPVETGDLDLCFHASGEPFSGSVRLRIDLVTPDGRVTTLHSHDTLTWLQGKGTCTESDTKCCNFQGASTDALPTDAGAPADADVALDGSLHEQSEAEPSAPAAHGCSTLGMTRARSPQPLALVCGAAWLLARSRRPRRSLRRARRAPP